MNDSIHNSSSDDQSAQAPGQSSPSAVHKPTGKLGAARKGPVAPKQSGFIKLIHGLIILSLLVMSTSGLAIYNSNPVFGGREGWHFPKFLLLGGWLAGVLAESVGLWHLHCHHAALAAAVYFG
jgi:thiosulfate reductase cytochrome b subunit